jgi:N-methylhydantoinase A
MAPVWSALGAATADVTHIYQDPRTLDMPAPAYAIYETFAALEAAARERLRAEGFDDSEIELVRSVRAKHNAQIHHVEVPVAAGEVTDEVVAQIDRDFERIYEERYGRGAGYREAGVHIIGFQVRASGLTYKPRIAPLSGSGEVVELERPVYWSEEGTFVDTPVLGLDSGALPRELSGPALVELPHTVVVVRPGQTARSDRYGNVLIRV